MEHRVHHVGTIFCEQRGKRVGVRAVDDMIDDHESGDPPECSRDLLSGLETDRSFGVRTTHQDRDASGFRHGGMVA
jgi:hypothetical protein